MSIQFKSRQAKRSGLRLVSMILFSAESLSLATISPSVFAQPAPPSACAAYGVICGFGANGWVVSPTTTIPNPETLKREIEQRNAPPPGEQPPQPEIRRELGKPEDELHVDVTRYLIKGLSRPVPAALEARLQPYTGKARSYEDLSNAADIVTQYLQSELGLYLGYAYLPEQKMRDGIIEIDVLEGRLDRVILNWDESLPVSRSVVEAHLAHLKPGDVLRVRDVERVVFLTNDLLGMSARFEVKAGSTPGTATLVVTPRADKRITGQLDADNHGSRFSGEYRAGLGVALNSPLGRGDGLAFNTLSSRYDGMNFGLLSYSMPIGSDGLKAGLSFSKMHYELDPDELPLDLRGDARTETAFTIYPLVRSRNVNIFSTVSVDRRKYVDRQAAFKDRVAEEKHSQVGQFGLTGDFRDSMLSGGVNTLSLNYTYGRVKSDQSSFMDQEQDRIKKVGLSYSRLQNLIDNRALLLLRYTGQFAFANLDATERFNLGGANGIRAYAPGEATGDQGHITTAELRLLAPNSWGPDAREFVGSIFYDAGWLKLQHKENDASIGQDQSRFLHGIGMGLVWERPRDFVLRGSVAWRLGDRGIADREDRVPRIYFSLSKKFD